MMVTGSGRSSPLGSARSEGDASFEAVKRNVRRMFLLKCRKSTQNNCCFSISKKTFRQRKVSGKKPVVVGSRKEDTMFSIRWRLFRLLGIPINVDASWLIILALLTWTLASLFLELVPDLSPLVYWAMGLGTALA